MYFDLLKKYAAGERDFSDRQARQLAPFITEFSDNADLVRKIFPHVSPKQRCEALGRLLFDAVGKVNRDSVNTILTLAEQTGGKELVAHLLSSDERNPIQHAVWWKVRSEDKQLATDLLDKLQSADTDDHRFTKRLFENEYSSAITTACDGHAPELLRRLLTLAKDIEGTDKIERILKSNDYRLFTMGDAEELSVLLEFARPIASIDLPQVLRKATTHEKGFIDDREGYPASRQKLGKITDIAHEVGGHSLVGEVLAHDDHRLMRSVGQHAAGGNWLQTARWVFDKAKTIDDPALTHSAAEKLIEHCHIPDTRHELLDEFLQLLQDHAPPQLLQKVVRERMKDLCSEWPPKDMGFAFHYRSALASAHHDEKYDDEAHNIQRMTTLLELAEKAGGQAFKKQLLHDMGGALFQNAVVFAFPKMLQMVMDLLREHVEPEHPGYVRNLVLEDNHVRFMGYLYRKVFEFENEFRERGSKKDFFEVVDPTNLFKTQELLLETANKLGEKDQALIWLKQNNYQIAKDMRYDPEDRHIGKYIEWLERYGGQGEVRNLLKTWRSKDIYAAVNTTNNAVVETMFATAERIGSAKLVGELLRKRQKAGLTKLFNNNDGEGLFLLLKAADKSGDAALVKSLCDSASTFILTYCGLSDDWDRAKQALDIAARHQGKDYAKHLLVRYKCQVPRFMAERNALKTLTGMLEYFPSEEREKVMAFLPHNWQLLNRKVSKPVLQQELGGHADRWITMVGQEAPAEVLQNESPYHFKRKLYDKLLPLMTTAAKLEQDGESPQFHAYKLSVLFNNEREAERYIDRYAEEWAESGTKQLIHDALQFDIPRNGLWDTDKWKELVLRYGPKATRYLAIAPAIEAALKKNNAPFPKTMEDLREAASKIMYPRAKENEEFAWLAFHCLLREEDFDKGLELLKRAKKSDRLPDIFIDGNDIGFPNYYMQKLAPDDPRGLVLGKLTNCCQYVGNEYSHSCVEHGMTSENSAFYVWKRKTNNKITDKDPIVAQSWTWLGTEGNIVFDSFERLGPAYDALSRPFLEHYAWLAEKEHHIPGIRLGTGGNSPRLNMAATEKPSSLEGYNGYSDAKGIHTLPNGEIITCHQLIIMPRCHTTDKEHKLPPPGDDREVELAARQYIRGALNRIKEKYGIEIRAGIELEFYALDEDGRPSSKVFNLDEVNKEFASSPAVTGFEDENTIDYYGQYEVKVGVNPPKATPKELRAKSPVLEGKAGEYRRKKWEAMPDTSEPSTERDPRYGNPLRAADTAQALRKLMIRKAKGFAGTLGGVDFSALPFKDKEASGVHINVSLWDTSGNPLFANEKGEQTALLKQVSHHMIESQKNNVILFAQSDNAYKRFGNTQWSPTVISCADHGDAGTTLRIANADNLYHLKEAGKPEDTRLENRITPSDANYVVAMAATVAGIELALQKSVTVHPKDAATPSGQNAEVMELADRKLAVAKHDQPYPDYNLPTSRHDALERFKQHLDSDEVKILGSTLQNAVLAQHSMSPRNARAV